MNPAGLRERKKTATRRALAAAALRLAVERGPQAVTVEEIAAAVEVSTRTFFNYFASKEEAIFGIAVLNPSELYENLVARPRDEPALVALRNAIVDIAAYFEAEPEEWELRHRLLGEHPYLVARFAAEFGRFEQELTREVAARLHRDPDQDPYPRVMVAAALGAARTAVGTWQARKRREPLTAVIDEAFGYLESGFGSG